MTDVITIDEYTKEVLDGTGVFDTMMRATKGHIAEEFNKGRIKGPEYSTVYLGALNAVGDRALEFLLRKDEVYLKNEALKIEIERAAIERDKAAAEKALIDAQVLKVQAEVTLVDAEIDKARAQVAVFDAQADKTRAEIDLLAGELDKIASEVNKNNAQTALITQQAANAIIEGKVLEAQECKIKAEFELLVEQQEKTKSETGLLMQKKVTEQAQTNGAAVSDDSVLGKQIILYGAQADGFTRDAEQKAAKILVDSWNVRRTTDEGTIADATNGLLDANIGRSINKLLAGVNA